MPISIEQNNLSEIMSKIYSVIDTDETARQKVNLILTDQLLTIQDGDLAPTKLTPKERQLQIFKVYLDLVME